MQQEVQYSVEKIGTVTTNVLRAEDATLVGTYTITGDRFQVGYSTLTVSIRDLNETLLAVAKDVDWYTVRGNNIGDKAVQISVEPVENALSLGFLGDVYVDYEAFDNLLGKDQKLFVTEISTDRTEFRAKSLDLSTEDFKSKVLGIYKQLNELSYFSEVYLDFEDLDEKQIAVNVIAEVVDGQQVVTFKSYEALPSEITEKSIFKVLKRIGEPVRFKVTRTVKIIPDKVEHLKGPNFGIDTQTSNTATDYLSCSDLISYKESGSFLSTVQSLGQKGVHVSVDHEHFENFVHFSSAVERLENARYKFELLWDYLDKVESAPDKQTQIRYRKLADGLVSSFDHYEKFLYCESGSMCWPKVSSKRPFENVRHYLDIDGEKGFKDWWEKIVESADVYDLHNEDILIGTIPLTIREDPNNEPYITFVHMIGQHFDELWLYAKAISDKYKADNRVDFGVSKDLVKQAIEDLGISLSDSSTNLESLFECFKQGSFEKGEETSVEEVKQIDGSKLYQPMSQDDYFKEVYKRIYHNVPTLLKTKGTVRCIRVLLNCFGIPEDIITLHVYGGIDNTIRPYYSPGERVFKYSDKIRDNNPDVPVKEYVKIADRKGTFEENSVLSRYVEIDKRPEKYSDDEHRVELGFNVNEASSKYFRDSLKGTDLDLEDSFGDPRNQEDQYGDPYKRLREQVLSEIGKGKRFQSPASIVRLAQYFDSTFFRIVKDFLPARATLTTGVVVEDNTLHRNRYRGVRVSYENKIYTASIDTAFITGSSGLSLDSKVRPAISGSWIYETNTRPIVRSCDEKGCTKTWTVNHVTESRTGEKIYSRSVFDDSPKYNGILSGSNLTVTEGWLTSNNPHHKSLQALENYGVCMFFLDLPEPPFCTVQSLVESYNATCYLISSSFDTTFYEIVQGTLQKVSDYGGSIYDALVNCNSASAVFVADSKSFAEKETVPARGYEGWYERHEALDSFDSRDVEFLTPHPRLLTDKDTWWKLGPRYTNYSGNKYRFEVQLDYLNEAEYYKYYSYSYGYRPGDFILSWRFINQNNFPVSWSEAVWTEIGDVVCLIKPVGYEPVEVTLPVEDLYGTKQGYSYLVINLGVEGIDSIESFGIKSAAGGYRGPWISSKGFIDADWFECYDIWGTGSLARQDRWTVVSSSRYD